jgi:ATP-dependent DNA helicase RecQ
VGNIEKSNVILKKAIEKIKNGEVETSRITKTVLVIDEAQDIDEDEFNLINSLMEQNEEMRVIAVGDDDQNIYEFRGANSKYLEQFIHLNKASKYELVENYRSKKNLVEFANEFVQQIHQRLKESPIIAKQASNGKIKLVRHQSNNLISPLIHDLVSSGLSGSTCVLTKTNEEAFQITALLLKNKIPAKLIQTNEGFDLINISEVRFFLNQLNLADGIFIISDENWAKAKQELIAKFHNSSKLEICNNIIRDFETTNPAKKYKSDLEVFIRESKLEDFFNENGETVFVSTIHKAKGKEFHNVFLMLENFDTATDTAKRQLYVAITRAKQNLTIHLNSSLFNNISVEGLERVEDREVYLPPTDLAMNLTLKDIWLDYSINKQQSISELTSGDPLVLNGNECLNSKRQSVLKFSKQLVKQIELMREKQYELRSANVNFIVYWQKEGSDQEIKIILPELHFERTNSNFQSRNRFK